VKENLKRIAAEVAASLEKIEPGQFEAAAAEILKAPNLFLAGAGRSGRMVEAFAIRLAQLGLSAYLAGGATTPAITAGDLLVIGSGSGRTAGLLAAAQTAREAGARLLIFTAEPESPLARLADRLVVIPAGGRRRAGQGRPNSIQPLATLFEQSLLLLLDGLVLRLMKARRVSAAAMAGRHANLE